MESQGELIPAEELPDGFNEAAGRLGLYTGERVRARDPERYQAVVDALANGQSIRQVARAWHLHHRTVAAIRDCEGESIDTVKKRVAGELRLFTQLAAERMVDEYQEIPIEKLAISMGIAAEKSELLDGRPTSIVDHRDSRRIGDLGSIIDAIEVETEQVAPAMGLTGQGESTKGRELEAAPVDPAEGAELGPG